MDWITCPSCGLKHSPRPDGLCPRCRTRAGDPAAAGAPPPQPPLATQAWPPAPPPLEPPPLDPAGAPPLPTTPWGAPPAAGAPKGPEVTVGSIVNKTFSIWWANFGKFFGTLLLAYLPLVLVGVGAGAYGAAAGGALGEVSPALIFLIALCAVAFIVLALAQFGGVTYATLQHLAGKRTSIGAMFGVGIRRAWPLFLVGAAGSLLVMLGFVALVVPGVIAALGLTVAYSVVVTERVGTVDAIKRSFALTKGKRGTIFGALFVVMCAMWMASLAGNLATAAAASNQVLALVGLAFSLVAQLALTPLTTVAMAVAYHDLRVAKEGVDTSQLASVFE